MPAMPVVMETRPHKETTYNGKTVDLSINLPDGWMTTNQILENLKISPSTLRRYSRVLRKAAPDDFGGKTKVYSPVQVAAIEKMQGLVKTGFTYSQIEEQIANEGI